MYEFSEFDENRDADGILENLQVNNDEVTITFSFVEGTPDTYTFNINDINMIDKGNNVIIHDGICSVYLLVPKNDNTTKLHNITKRVENGL